MDGPLKSAFDNLKTQGVVSHTLTTTRYVNSKLRIEEVTRNYYANGDYIDHSITKPIGEGSTV